MTESLSKLYTTYVNVLTGVFATIGQKHLQKIQERKSLTLFQRDMFPYAADNRISCFLVSAFAP